VRYFGEAYLALTYREQTMTFIKEHVWGAVAIGLALAALFYAVNRWSARKVKVGA
jgi:hypothetical protein